MNETWIQVITIIISNLMILLTFFGIFVSLHNQTKAEIMELRSFHYRKPKEKK